MATVDEIDKQIETERKKLKNLRQQVKASEARVQKLIEDRADAVMKKKYAKESP